MASQCLVPVFRDCLVLHVNASYNPGKEVNPEVLIQDIPVVRVVGLRTLNGTTMSTSPEPVGGVKRLQALKITGSSHIHLLEEGTTKISGGASAPASACS